MEGDPRIAEKLYRLRLLLPDLSQSFVGNWLASLEKSIPPELFHDFDDLFDAPEKKSGRGGDAHASRRYRIETKPRSQVSARDNADSNHAIRQTAKSGKSYELWLRARELAPCGPEVHTWEVREELKWVWRTKDRSCPWHPMDRNDFCRRIGSNRNLMVVGDSINHEISVAIQNALAMNKSSAVTEQKHPGEELCSDVLGGVGKGFAVHFARNDYVSPVVNSTSLGRTFQDPWMPKVDNGGDNVKILVLNRGAHYQDDKRFVEGLRTTFEALRNRHPELLVIYRNTPSELDRPGDKLVKIHMWNFKS